MIWEEEKEFWEFRKEHPEMRFWQALRAFANVDSILIREGDATADTFYFQDIKIK